MALISSSQLDAFVAALGRDPRLVHLERLAPRAARTSTLAEPLPPGVRERLGVDAFWSHQAEAIDLVRAGRSVAIATGTASGKSLCYQAPIAASMVENIRPATALLVFPTKALSHDQLRALTAMEMPKLVAATYDGDSGPEERTWVRQHANVVLTNPEMLHHGVLPNHARWATFLMRLRYVVVDELHLLRGIFGTHVAHLLRRLRRLAAHYGAEPTFVFTSATIGSPDVLAAELCGLPVTAVTADGSPRGERLFALWNPMVERPIEGGRAVDDAQVIDLRSRSGTPDEAWPDNADGPTSTGQPLDDEDGIDEDGRPITRRRASANQATASLVSRLMVDGHRSIAFCRSRKGTEVVAADISRRVPGYLRNAVRAYRAGYLPTERREIEHEIWRGDVRAVVATTALELGVDIGGLDACVLNGFPGTIASMWQQAGRAGREAQQSLAVLVAGDDQLDQWLMAHPDQVFTRPPEAAVINVANPYVLLPHLACAAYEQPLTRQDERFWPDLLDDGVRDLVLDDRLRLRDRGRKSVRHPIAVWAGRGWPANAIGLRGGANDEVRIVLRDDTLVGTADLARACRLVHPGAIYLHRGHTFRVTTLDLDDRVALVEPCPSGEHTQPRAETEISILGTDRSTTVGRSRLGLGTVRVRSRVVGYRRIDSFTGTLIGVEDLHLPSQELVTRAFWYVIDPEVLLDAGVDPPDWPGALHAVEHAAIGMMPLFTICDRWDVGGVSTALQADTGAPTIVVYDAHAGGAGVAELGFEAADRHLAATLEVIESCPCTDGCPSCVQSPKCGNGNEPLDKRGAIALLHAILERSDVRTADGGSRHPEPPLSPDA